MKIEDLAVIGAQMSKNYSMDAILAAKGNVAYVLNSECTVLLQYIDVADVQDEVRWKSLDWERGTARMDGDEVVFFGESGGCKRTKRCSAPTTTFSQLEEAWKVLMVNHTSDTANLTMTAALAKEHLDDSLSHVEFWFENGTAVIKQRDLYSGTLITVELPSSKRQVGGFFSTKPQPFERTSLRTKDLLALLSLEASLTFCLGKNASTAKGTKFTAIISNCVYDSLYTVEELTNGWKEQEVRQGEQSPDTKAEGTEGTNQTQQGPNTNG